MNVDSSAFVKLRDQAAALAQQASEALQDAERYADGAAAAPEAARSYRHNPLKDWRRATA